MACEYETPGECGCTVPEEDPMVAFYRRDNEELRKFLNAERIENNRLRGCVSDLNMACGMAIGTLRTLASNEVREAINVGDMNKILETVIHTANRADARLTGAGPEVKK